MKIRMGFGFIAIVVTLALPAAGQIQKHFSEVSNRVKAMENASDKRIILNESLQNMLKVLDIAQSSPSISKADFAGIERVRTTLQEKQDELAGLNGFNRVQDAQLNAFSEYVVQDMEQADQMITISVVTLLLILILVVIIL
ncbi:MAG TPA: hypothetical protein VGA55_03435 [Bacteroidota bacterium]